MKLSHYLVDLTVFICFFVSILFFSFPFYIVCVRIWGCVIDKTACKPMGKHREGDESLCTLAAFREVVEQVRPQDFGKECRLIGISPYFIRPDLSRSGEIAKVIKY